MARSILAQLVVALRDDASGPAKALAGTLKGLEKSAVDFAKTMSGAKWGSSFTRQLGGLKATQDELDKIKKSWADLQGQLSGAKGRLKTDAQRQWANEWITRLQAVRVANQQNTEEAIRNAKRQAAEEKKAAAETARTNARLAREEARAKERAARDAARAAIQAQRDTSKEARDAAREQERLARNAARAARETAREQTRAAREASREAVRAQRLVARQEREGGRGAGSIGRSVARNLVYAAGGGAGTYMVGRGVRGTARAGGEALREDARDYLAGLTPAESKRIADMATTQSGNYKSLTSTSLHNLYRETSMTALNIEGTSTIAPDLAKGLVILQSLKGKDEALSQLTGFMRGLDTLGKNVDPAVVRSLVDGMTRAAGVQGVEYNPKQIFTMAKQSRSAGGALSTEFLNTIAPSLIADMGPAAPGTALATLMSSVVGGTLSGGNTKQKMARMRELGLRNKDNSLSGRDRDMMTQNPHLYAWDRLIPTMQGQGVDVKNEGAVSEFLNKIFTRTVADVFGKLISQKEQYQLTQSKLAKAPGLEGAAGVEGMDPFVALAGVTSQITNTAAEISKPIIETIMPALNGLAGGINRLATSIRNNPEFSKDFGEAAGGAGAGGLIGGGIKALQALWQARGIQGAIAGGMRGGLAGAVIGGVGGALLPDVWRFATGETGRATPGQKSANQIDQGTYERARRAQDEFRRDPEGARGRAMMRGADAAPAADVPSTVPAPTVDAGAAAASGQAAGTALGAGVATGIAAQQPAVEAQGRSIMDRLRSLFSSGVTVPVRVQASGGATAGDGATPATAPARGSGGSVAAGGLYRVNEFGEEFYQPTEDGRIIDPRRKAAGGGGEARTASISMSNSISVTGVSDPEAAANRVIAEIEDRIQAAARAAFADMGVELA